MLLIMLMLIERNGEVSQKDFAARVHNWMLHGFKEFGDLGKFFQFFFADDRFNCVVYLQVGWGLG